MLEIYPAEAWPEQTEADHGLYRVRIDDCWVSIGGRKYTFFTPEALGRLIAAELTAPGALAVQERPAPRLRKGQWVRWCDPDGACGRTRLMSEPNLWLDGQWRAWINFYPRGPVLVCCDELKPVDVFGREEP